MTTTYNITEMTGIERCLIAKDPSTPVEILRELAEDGNWFVRVSVARNPAATPEILGRIAVNTADGARIVAEAALSRSRVI